MSVKDYLKRLFFVHKCASCRQILPYECFDEALCDKCRAAVEGAKTESCPECFKGACECVCQTKMLSSAGSLCLCKLFFYHTDKENEPQNRLIYSLKHYPNRRAFSFAADEMWKCINRELENMELSGESESLVFVSVPRGRAALRQYGFDQSDEICKRMSKISGIPYVKALSRKNGGKEQKKLTSAERKSNIQKLICKNELYAEQIKGKYVLLFDDIVTTGSSMSVCITILRKMGAKGIICCSLAKDLKIKSGR